MRTFLTIIAMVTMLASVACDTMPAPAKLSCNTAGLERFEAIYAMAEDAAAAGLPAVETRELLAFSCEGFPTQADCGSCIDLIIANLYGARSGG